MRLSNVYKENHVEIIKYNPSITKPFFIEMETTTLMRRFRFLIDYFYGFRVYYLKIDHEYVGYCTITNGKNPRYWFAKEGDIIIGPYYINESYRNNGLSTFLVNTIIHNCETNWHKAYVYILNDNYPSIHVTEKVGGRLLFHVHNTFYRKLIKCEDGEYGVYEVDK